VPTFDLFAIVDLKAVVPSSLGDLHSFKNIFAPLRTSPHGSAPQRQSFVQCRP